MEHLGPTIEKIKYGRYQIKPAPDKPRTGYTRTTTITKTLDDQSSLIPWNAGRTALGLVAQPHLYAAIAACDPNNKKELYALCEKAAEAGGAATRREQGTAIHKFMERKIADATYEAPAPYNADVESIFDALDVAGFEISENYSEFIVVNHKLKIAGTADLALRHKASGKLYIADLKTGSSVQYGAQAWAIQLHFYASADAIYIHDINPDNDKELPLPKFEQDRGIIIHCEPASGKTNLYWIDLDSGRVGLELALLVRQFRNTKPLTAFTDVEAATSLKTVPNVQYVDELWLTMTRDRIVQIMEYPEAKNDLADNWPANVPTLKSGEPITIEQGKTISDMLSLIEKTHQLPFIRTIVRDQKQVIEEPVEIVQQVQEKPALVSFLDENKIDKDDDPIIGEDEIGVLRVMINFLERDARFWAQDILEQCRQENVTLAVLPPKGQPFERRFNLTKTILHIAPTEDIEILAGIVRQCTKRPFKNVVKGLGQLTLKQSQKALELAEKFAYNEIIAVWQEDGNVTFVPNPHHNGAA